MTLIGIPRVAPTVGRGGARYSTFVYAGAKQDPPLTEAGPVNADLYWERITYFLERVVPVAAEHKVRIACHPQDPGMPPGKGWRGVETVLGSVEGLKRFVSISESPYHGLNFCQGTVSEMLEKPGEEILDVIRYFGQRQKIFNVHFRNIAGGFLNFRETFIDDGDVDMLKACRRSKGTPATFRASRSPSATSRRSSPRWGLRHEDRIASSFPLPASSQGRSCWKPEAGSWKLTF
jgi:mannonate dehydratase